MLANGLRSKALYDQISADDMFTSLQSSDSLYRGLITVVQWTFRTKDKNSYKFVEYDFTPPLPVSGGKSYVITQFWNVLRKRGLQTSKQQHVEAQRGMGKKTSPILGFISRHNVWFGKEPNREAIGEVLKCFIEPIWLYSKCAARQCHCTCVFS